MSRSKEPSPRPKEDSGNQDKLVRAKSADWEPNKVNTVKTRDKLKKLVNEERKSKGKGHCIVPKNEDDVIMEDNDGNPEDCHHSHKALNTESEGR